MSFILLLSYIFCRLIEMIIKIITQMQNIFVWNFFAFVLFLLSISWCVRVRFFLSIFEKYARWRNQIHTQNWGKKHRNFINSQSNKRYNIFIFILGMPKETLTRNKKKQIRIESRQCASAHIRTYNSRLNSFWIQYIAWSSHRTVCLSVCLYVRVFAAWCVADAVSLLYTHTLTHTHNHTLCAY